MIRSLVKKLIHRDESILYEYISEMTNPTDRILLCDRILKQNADDMGQPHSATSCETCGIWLGDIEYGYEFCVTQQCRSCLKFICVGCNPNIHYIHISCAICDRSIPVLCDTCNSQKTNMCFNCQYPCTLCDETIRYYDEDDIISKHIGNGVNEYLHRECFIANKECI